MWKVKKTNQKVGVYSYLPAWEQRVHFPDIRGLVDPRRHQCFSYYNLPSPHPPPVAAALDMGAHESQKYLMLN